MILRTVKRKISMTWNKYGHMRIWSYGWLESPQRNLSDRFDDTDTKVEALEIEIISSGSLPSVIIYLRLVPPWNIELRLCYLFQSPSNQLRQEHRTKFDSTNNFFFVLEYQYVCWCRACFSIILVNCINN